MFLRLARGTGIWRLSPIWLTAIALAFGLLTAVALWRQAYSLGFAFWFLNRLFDGLDGTVARVRDLQSDLGGYVDILGDFIVYAAIPIGLVAADPSPPVMWALALLLSSFYINGASWMYLSAILEKRRNQPVSGQKTSVNMPAGLIGGAETIIFYSLFILFPRWLVLLFLIMALLVMVTIGQRVVWAFQNLN